MKNLSKTVDGSLSSNSLSYLKPKAKDLSKTGDVSFILYIFILVKKDFPIPNLLKLSIVNCQLIIEKGCLHE